MYALTDESESPATKLRMWSCARNVANRDASYLQSKIVAPNLNVLVNSKPVDDAVRYSYSFFFAF